MSITRPWVAEAIASLGVAGHVRLLEGNEAAKVLDAVSAAFLEIPDARFWWSHLRMPFSSWQTENGFRFIPEIVPGPNTPSWFISGLSDDEKSVFECVPAILPALIGECPGFEYAVVDQCLKWILIESHHDIIIAAGQIAPERLARLRGQSADALGRPGSSR